MNNVNVVSTPNIEGNIGSCKTEKVTVETGNHFWYTTEKTITTNSCNGHQIMYDTWSLGAGFWFPCILFIGIILALVKASDV